MSSTLDDFFGDSSEAVEECLYCGGTDGELVVAVSDHNGPTHWEHKACADDAGPQGRLCTKEDSKGNWQPLFSKGFM